MFTDEEAPLLAGDDREFEIEMCMVVDWRVTEEEAIRKGVFARGCADL
jgi:hypothetical protein